MTRRNQANTGIRMSGPKVSLIMSTALASVALASCTASAPPAEVSFSKAQNALEDGRIDRAVAHAEEAVLADPRNGNFRAILGAAYLEAGRFESAATAFGDAIELGNTDSRTVLSYALAKIATGDNRAALTKLAEHEGSIPSADLGLALALAGQPERGVHYLVGTVRAGESSAKARQNLAYAYALAGNWPAARVMAAEDVPADQLEGRLSDWASTARPEDYQIRVANLLGVDPVSDGGQPQYLALSNFPTQATMVAEAAAMADEEPAPAPVVEEAPVAVAVAAPVAAPAPAPSAEESNAIRFESRPVVQNGGAAPARAPTRVAAAPAPAPAESAPTPRVSAPTRAAAPTAGATRFVSNAVVQDVPPSAERAEPAPRPAARPAPQRRMAVATGSAATHLVQLGAFESRAVAESKWGEFKRRFPQLAQHDVVITEAQVNGRTYFRVAAAGFGARTARSMCNTVKASGRGCFAYAASNPPAGAVDRGVRIAARSR